MPTVKQQKLKSRMLRPEMSAIRSDKRIFNRKVFVEAMSVTLGTENTDAEKVSSARPNGTYQH